MRTKRIAVVDDDPSVRRVILRSVRSLLLDGEAFASAEELLAAGAAGFDCLIVDLHMPGIGGVELLQRLLDINVDVPSIVVTARPRPAMLELARSRGAVAVLLKPFDLATLETCIGEALDG